MGGLKNNDILLPLNLTLNSGKTNLKAGMNLT